MAGYIAISDTGGVSKSVGENANRAKLTDGAVPEEIYILRSD
jgi:hypothetical protein